MADDQKQAANGEPRSDEREEQKGTKDTEDQGDKKEDAQKSSQPPESSEAKTEEAKTEEKSEEPKQEEVKENKSSESSESSKPSKPPVSVSPELEKIIEKIEKLSVLELSQLVKALEEKFGVSAAPAMVAGAAPAAGGDDAGRAEEQTTFNVVLAESGANKISVIKAVRELVPTLGLKEAKDLVDSPPKPVLEGANKEAANEAKTKLEAAGAKVELK
jgi:large subunit ribosomal protein L7/L12